jgi:DCN1-like protein 1/2
LCYSADLQKGQKCLQIDTALAMWQLLYADERRWQYIDDWCEFLQTHHNRAISKDTWVQLFQFTRVSALLLRLPLAACMQG